MALDWTHYHQLSEFFACIDIHYVSRFADSHFNPIKAIEWKSDAKRPYDSRLELDEDFIKINNIYTQDWKTSVKSTVELIYNDYYAR